MNRSKRLVVAICSQAMFASACLAQSTITAPPPVLNLKPGWNLVGNNSNTAVSVSSVFSSYSASVATVWRWNTGTSGWDFYSPSQSVNVANYAAQHGYGVLSTLNIGDGFWVNVNATAAPNGLTINLPTTTLATQVCSSIPVSQYFTASQLASSGLTGTATGSVSSGSLTVTGTVPSDCTIISSQGPGAGSPAISGLISSSKKLATFQGSGYSVLVSYDPSTLIIDNVMLAAPTRPMPARRTVPTYQWEVFPINSGIVSSASATLTTNGIAFTNLTLLPSTAANTARVPAGNLILNGTLTTTLSLP